MNLSALVHKAYLSVPLSVWVNCFLIPCWFQKTSVFFVSLPIRGPWQREQRSEKGWKGLVRLQPLMDCLLIADRETTHWRSLLGKRVFIFSLICYTRNVDEPGGQGPAVLESKLRDQGPVKTNCIQLLKGVLGCMSSGLSWNAGRKMTTKTKYWCFALEDL